jgi:hypothetical protein
MGDIIMKRLLMLFAMLIIGCSNPAEPRKLEPLDNIGTIIFQDISGGFYGIVTDDSINYFPLDLEKRFMRDGMRISFNFSKPKYRVDTIVMWGEPIYITDIRCFKFKK